MSQGLSPKVFISHSSSGDEAAEAFVKLLCERLGAWGVDPWLDGDGLKPGRVWNDTLRLAIERCDAAILVITERYLRPGAHYARDEALLFVQRAATEPFDDFRLFVLLAPGVEPETLRNHDDWKNLEISRWQAIRLASVEPEALDALKESIEDLCGRYRSGAVPLVLREYYVDRIEERPNTGVLAQAVAALDLELSAKDATARRFVNAVLSASPQLRRPMEVIERSLRPWRQVLKDEVRCSMSWDAVAFSWLDDETARPIAEITRQLGRPGRKLLVLTSSETDTMRLHLRRVREYVSTFDDTNAQPSQTTRDGLIGAICMEIKARRARRETRDPSGMTAAELEKLARDLDKRVGATNPLVIVFGSDLCYPDLLDGVAELFSHVICVALASETQAQELEPIAVVVRPLKENDVLERLDAMIS